MRVEMSLRLNRWAQECAECAKMVAPQEGWFVQSERLHDMGQWIVYHPDCAPQHLQHKGQHLGKKLLTKTGHVIHPYDEAALGKLRALPGAWWDAKSKRWTVSLEAQDRKRLLDCAEELELEVDPELWVDATSEIALAAEKRALDAKLENTIADCARWLSIRKQAIVNPANSDHIIPATMCALDASRGTILVTDPREVRGWKKGHETLREDLTLIELQRKKDWIWPEAGQILLTTIGRLPNALAPIVLGTDPDGNEIKAVNLRPESRVACENTTLVLDDLNLVSSFSSRQSQKIYGLAGHTAATWFLWYPPIQYPSKLWDILLAGHMTQTTFANWKEYKRCFGGVAGRWNRMSWTHTEPEALSRLQRICYERPEIR